MSGRVVRGAIVFLGIVATPSASVHAGVVRVPQDQPTIASALAVAVSGDSVVVSPGTYHEHDVMLPRAVTLRSESGDPANTILDAAFGGTILRAEHAIGPVVIEGFTIMRGTAVQ